MKEKIKENAEKIKVNKTLPYLVSNVIEILDVDPQVLNFLLVNQCSNLEPFPKNTILYFQHNEINSYLNSYVFSKLKVLASIQQQCFIKYICFN